MNSYRTIALVALLVVGTNSASAGGLNEAIAKTAREDGVCDPSRVASVQIDSTRQGYLYQFHACGGNLKMVYLIVVGSPHSEPKVIKVGQDYSFMPERIEVRNGYLYLSGPAWNDDDPHCCPSRTATQKLDIGQFGE